MNVLMSIKPEFVERIVAGEKLYEFRKSVFKEEVDRIFIYSTYPQREIVGHFNPSQIVCTSPEDLWSSFSDVSGISEKDFFKYYEGKSEGYAIRIDDLHIFKKPIGMDKYEEFKAPQSYCYVENDEFLKKLLL